MINIIYGHTSYIDILNIQSDYVSKYENRVLFLNRNNDDLDDLYSKYDKVIFYNDSNPYAYRLIECINQIDYEYFTFIHDIDILMKMDEEKIESMYSFMIKNDIDRIDLKYTNDLNTIEAIKIDSSLPDDWNMVSSIGDGLYLIRQTNPNNFIYNVNPSIWKRSSFLNILLNFPNKTYRNIEDIDVQNYCMRLVVYKIFSDKVLECGYFQCVEPFVYLHITHGGNLLLLDGNNKTEYGQSYIHLSEEYNKIFNKYDLIKFIKK